MEIREAEERYLVRKRCAPPAATRGSWVDDPGSQRFAGFSLHSRCAVFEVMQFLNR